MTENKRFTIKGTWSKSLNRLKGVICDNNKDMYITDVVYLLNKLSEENEQLKDILKDIIIQLDANHTMNTYQVTIPINQVIYNELSRKLKETSFNEELRRFLE